MNEKYDIFISYCQDDNTPFIPGDDPGWVSDLHETLDTRLKQVRGESCKIFRDTELGGIGATLSDAIRKRIEDTTFLLVIVSPLYINSKWCNLERDAFINKFGVEEGINNIIRIDKLLDPPPPEQPEPPLPQELENKYGYRFYENDPETNKPTEISLRKDKVSAKKFHAVINDIAYHLREVLNEEPPIDDSRKNTIYLADTSSDMQECRMEIERELSQRRYNIIPNKQLSTLHSETRNRAKECLERSFLSIHIVGKEYEPLQQYEDNQSIIELQFDEAIKMCSKNELKTLVWMPTGLEPSDQNQKKLIKKMQNDENKDDFIICTIEDFKTEINTVIDSKEREIGYNEPKEPKGKTVYLYCNKEDLSKDNRGKRTNHINDIKKTLYNEGYEVLTTEYEGDESEIKKIHQDYLKDCDAILLYLGASNRTWNRDVVIELRKHPDFDRSSPLLARGIYVEKDLDPPATQLATIIQGIDSYSSESLKRFLNKLESQHTHE